MAPDEMRNLGFKDEGLPAAASRSIEGEAAIRAEDQEKKS